MADAVLPARPVEERADGFGDDAPATVLGLDVVAHLHPPGRIGRRMEADRADDPRTIRFGGHDRPAEPRLGGRVHGEIRDPELEESVQTVRQVGWDGRADLRRRTRQVPGEQAPHERYRHGDQRVVRGGDRRGGLVGHRGIIAADASTGLFRSYPR